MAENIIPALPLGAVTETNRETLKRFKDDLAWVDEQLLSAADAYRMYIYEDPDHPVWGYCVENAQVENPRDILVLMRSNGGQNHATKLQWMSMSKVYTRKLAHLRYGIVDTEGPAEDVMIEILQLLRDVFECAVEDGWSYRKRMEFYHAFPFDDLRTKEAVKAFRPILFDCPAVSGCRRNVSASE